MSKALSPRKRELRRSLQASVADGIAWSVMTGCGEWYIPALALASGSTGIAAGLIATLPFLAGALLQTAAPRWIERARSNRRWVAWCVTGQGLSLLLFSATAWAGGAPTWLLFAIATLYWATGLASGPAWLTWMGSMVPGRIRAGFFAARGAYINGALLLSILGAGAILERAKAERTDLMGFAALFAIAGGARLLCTYFVSLQREPVPLPPGRRPVPVRELPSLFARMPGVRTLLFILLFSVAMQIAGPFFAPFVLKQAGMSYQAFAVLSALPFLGKALATAPFGLIAKRWGSIPLLWIGSLGLVPVTGLWMGGTWEWLLAAQALAGVALAAFDLAGSILFVEAIPENERTGIMTHYFVAASLGAAAGSAIGAGWLSAFGEVQSSYLAAFGLSIAARTLSLLVLRKAG